MSIVVGVVDAVDLYCAIRRDWSFAAAEVDGDGEKHGSESGEEVCGWYGDEEEGVRGHGGLHKGSIDWCIRSKERV